MALGFGSTRGVNSADRVVTASETIPAQFSFHIWANRNGEGGGSLGRIFDRGSFLFFNNNPNTAGTYALGLNAAADTRYRWARPAAGVWAPTGFSVDTTSSANTPTVYQSGTKLTIGSGVTRDGAAMTWPTASAAWCIGNRVSDGIRGWDGDEAEIAWWNVILTDDEFYALQKGISPNQIRPEALQHYFPFIRSGAIDKWGAPATVTGTAAQPHPPIIYAHRRVARKLVTATVSEHNLIIANATQANTGTAVAVTQDHALTGDANVQTNTASDVEISVGVAHDLSVSSPAQENTGASAAITQDHVLVFAASIQDNIAAASAIVQEHILALENASQGNIASDGEIVIVDTNDLAVDPVTQGNIAGTGAVTRTQTLTAENAVQANNASTGALSDGIIFETALATVTGDTTGLKKPGIPNDTPAWLKTTIEIVLGRRGNRIEVPEQQTLTFSSTPTQAECEALLNYTNTVRSSLEQLINRLDS